MRRAAVGAAARGPRFGALFVGNPMRITVIVAALAGLAGPVWASDPLVGLWQTQPDRKNLTSQIEIRACGAAFCGRIMRAFDPSGVQVSTSNIGKELFWDLLPEGAGRYHKGTVFLPLLNVKAAAKMQLQGDQLKVTACKAAVCDGQTWTRVR